MDITDNQQRRVQEWAERTPCVEEVWLFGSRAKGGSKPDSDIDLALKLGPVGATRTLLGNYYVLSERWTEELTEVLQQQAHVALLNDPEPSPIPASCEECSYLLFRRRKEPG
jgi:predicted nucleotidyltransferase